MSFNKILSVTLTERGKRYADKYGEWPKFILAETAAYDCLMNDHPNIMQTASGEVRWKGILLLRIASPGTRVFLSGKPLEIHVEDKRKYEPFVWIGDNDEA